MRLVKSVDIRDFRGIRRLEKPLELGEFNVLLGRNCSGKSSILQALFLLTMPFRGASVPPYASSAIELIEHLVGGSNRLVYGYSGEAEAGFELGVKGVIEILYRESGCGAAQAPYIIGGKRCCRNRAAFH